MSGGKVRDSYSPMSLQKELDQIHEKIANQQVRTDKLRDDCHHWLQEVKPCRHRWYS